MADQRSLSRSESPLARRTEDPFALLHQRMNRLFDDFVGNFPIGAEFAPFTRWPNVDVNYDNERVHVTADVPGLEQKDVQVSVEGTQLVISGERKSETEQKNRHWTCRERSYGSFERVIGLPSDVISEKAEAHFKNGVLTVDVPRKVDERTRARSVPIKTI